MDLINIIKFLNDNDGAFTILFSAIVALATVVYAILTWRLVTETKEMRKVQTEPKISVIFQPREEWINLIDLVIKNIGLGPAYDIKFEIKPDFEYRQGHFLSKLNFVKNGIKYLAPNQKMQFFLTSLVHNFEKKTKTPFDIKVTYNNKIGEPYTEIFTIDFSELVGLGQLGKPPLNIIAENIEKIQKDTHDISSGFVQLKLIECAKKDVEKQYKELEEKKKRTAGIKGKRGNK